MSWIGTVSGKQVEYLDPKPEQIDIEDIAAGLANVCRFAGQLETHYSVAQHCVLASLLVPKGFELAALLHDASEAYTGDCPRPLKHTLGEAWKAIESTLSDVICDRFGIARGMAPEVKEVDNRLLITERDAFQPSHASWEGTPMHGVKPYKIENFAAWTPEQAKAAYLERFAQLNVLPTPAKRKADLLTVDAPEPLILKFTGGPINDETADEAKPAANLPTDAAARKATPMATGVLDYFPLALAEVARLSKAGNDQHNPGQPLHWDKTKSTDHADCIVRHLIDRGTFDNDRQRHSAKVAWRALALLQTELEHAIGA